MDSICSHIQMLDITATPIPGTSVMRSRELEDNLRSNDKPLDLTSSPECNATRYHSHPDCNLSFFDHLPTEMIIAVFSFLDFSEANVLEINDGPWVLTQVCKRWREIVVHCPLFWIHVNFDLSFWHFTRTWPNRADLLVSTFLERSKEIPLNLQITWPDIKGASNYIVDAVEHLLNACRRWKTAVLDLQYGVYHELSTLIHGKLPLLESLTLKLNLPSKTPRNSLPMIDAFHLAPELRQVFIEGFPNAAKNVRLPWDQLTHLNAYHDHPNPNYHCLRLSSNLVECHIGSHGDLLQSPRGTYPSISLPLLRKLFIRGTGALILPYLGAPNTEVLCITDTPPLACSEECIEAVQFYIAECSESLKHLALHSDPLDYRVAEILYSTRELVSLNLRLALPKGSSLFEDLLKWLSYRELPKSNSLNSLTACLLGLLPRLENLSMRIEPSSADEEVFDICALTRMLVSRRTMPQVSEPHYSFKQLESFDLEVGNSLWKAEFSALETLNEMGLRTNVKFIR